MTAKRPATPVAQINVRIDRDLKEEGDAALVDAGLSPSQVVRDLWGKLAQGGEAAEAVVALLGPDEMDDDERAAIDARLEVVERTSRRREALAQLLGLSGSDVPLYPGGYDWHERAWSERSRKQDRRSV